MSGTDAPVVVYTREGCRLCRTAEEQVRELTAARGLDLTLVDVDTDAALVRAYGARVPVVAIDGVEVAELVVDAGLVADVLDRSSGGDGRRGP